MIDKTTHESTNDCNVLLEKMFREIKDISKQESFFDEAMDSSQIILWEKNNNVEIPASYKEWLKLSSPF